MAILFVGIDLAKNVFAVHGVNDAGKPELVRPAVARAKLLEPQREPCTLEARVPCDKDTPAAEAFPDRHHHTFQAALPSFQSSLT